MKWCKIFTKKNVYKSNMFDEHEGYRNLVEYNFQSNNPANKTFERNVDYYTQIPMANMMWDLHCRACIFSLLFVLGCFKIGFCMKTRCGKTLYITWKIANIQKVIENIGHSIVSSWCSFQNKYECGGVDSTFPTIPYSAIPSINH